MIVGKPSLATIAALALASAASCSDQSLPAPNVTNVDSGGVDSSVEVDAGGKRPGTIRIATFNLHRYFNTVCDSGNCKPSDFEAVLTQPAFDSQTASIARGLALIDPDIVSVEEVETQGVLDALNAKLAASGLVYPIAHLGETGSAGSVDVGILSRGTLTGFKTHRATPIKRPDGTSTTFTRELLETRMTFGARQVVMFSAHFRSQVDDDPGRRLAEAKAAHVIIGATATELPDALVVLGGDLNDRPGSEVINAIEEGGTLFRVAKDIVPDTAQGTYLFNGTLTALDHIFVVGGQQARYIAKSATIYRDDPRGFVGSDHAAIAADFSTE